MLAKLLNCGNQMLNRAVNPKNATSMLLSMLSANLWSLDPVLNARYISCGDMQKIFLLFSRQNARYEPTKSPRISSTIG